MSQGYSLRGGWLPSYRETSGYIAETFFDLAQGGRRETARETGLRIARWLLTVQNGDGSFSNPRFSGQRGIVFDTGQALVGLLRAHQADDGDPRFLGAALAAGRWLADRVDDDGAWRRDTYLGVIHTYNTRVAWIMLMLNALRPDPLIEAAAVANLDWALTQEKNGWFSQCAFRPQDPPFTHTIAYAIRGVWESGVLLGNEAYKATARRCVDAVMGLVREDGFLPGRIDTDGRPRSRSCCLTGNCQMAIICLKMHAEDGLESRRLGAERLLAYVKSCQDLRTRDANLRGAIKGSHPIWGHYAPLSYPNWATKFFVDAMLLVEASRP